MSVRRVPSREKQRLVARGTLALTFACGFIDAAAAAWARGDARAADGFTAGAVLFLVICAGLWARADLADLAGRLRRRDK